MFLGTLCVFAGFYGLSGVLRCYACAYLLSGSGTTASASGLCFVYDSLLSSVCGVTLAIVSLTLLNAKR